MSHHYVSQLAHVEINTPTPQASLEFFTDVLGPQISHREGQSDLEPGKAFRFTMPGGHRLDLVWEVERFVAPADQRSMYPGRQTFGRA